MTTLATVADLVGRLGISAPADGSARLTQMQDALEDASAAIADAVGCTLALTTSTVVLPAPGPTAGRAPGWRLLQLPAVPAVSIDSVLDEVGPVEHELLDAHTLRIGPSRTLLTITYTHGWDPIPGELKRWTLVLAASALAAAAAGNLGMAGGLSSLRVDDGQVSFAASDSGTAVDLPEAVRLRLRSTYGPST